MAPTPFHPAPYPYLNINSALYEDACIFFALIVISALAVALVAALDSLFNLADEGRYGYDAMDDDEADCASYHVGGSLEEDWSVNAVREAGATPLRCGGWLEGYGTTGLG